MVLYRSAVSWRANNDRNARRPPRSRWTSGGRTNPRWTRGGRERICSSRLGNRAPCRRSLFHWRSLTIVSGCSSACRRWFAERRRGRATKSSLRETAIRRRLTTDTGHKNFVNWRRSWRSVGWLIYTEEEYLWWLLLFPLRPISFVRFKNSSPIVYYLLFFESNGCVDDRNYISFSSRIPFFFSKIIPNFQRY